MTTYQILSALRCEVLAANGLLRKGTITQDEYDYIEKLYLDMFLLFVDNTPFTL